MTSWKSWSSLNKDEMTWNTVKSWTKWTEWKACVMTKTWIARRRRWSLSRKSSKWIRSSGHSLLKTVHAVQFAALATMKMMIKLFSAFVAQYLSTSHALASKTYQISTGFATIATHLASSADSWLSASYALKEVVPWSQQISSEAMTNTTTKR